jgi:hypothetical protein
MMPDKPKRFTKATLPSKLCLTCGRPFAWRKKWARVWDEVKYCSERCRASKPGPGVKTNPAKA